MPFENLRIVLVRNAYAAEYFINHLYDHMVDLVVVSADGAYPKRPEVKEIINHTIQTSEKLRIAVIGREALNSLIDCKTKNIFVLDDLIELDMYESSSSPYKQAQKLNFSKTNFMYLLHNFFMPVKLAKTFKSSNFNEIDIRINMNPWEYNSTTNSLNPSWKSAILGCDISLGVEETDFETAKKVWLSDLWSDRDPADTKPVSTMTLDNNRNISYDMAIKDQPAYFFVVRHRGTIVGINSGHKCNESLFRSRGLWVEKTHRKLGISKLLLTAVDNKARQVGCSAVWTYPRKRSLRAYESAGYEKISDWRNDGLFGPNCIAYKTL